MTADELEKLGPSYPMDPQEALARGGLGVVIQSGRKTVNYEAFMEALRDAARVLARHRQREM